MELGVIAMTEYSTFRKVLGVESHHPIVWYQFQDTSREQYYLSTEIQLVYSTAPVDWIDR